MIVIIQHFKILKFIIPKILFLIFLINFINTSNLNKDKCTQIFIYFVTRKRSAINNPKESMYLYIYIYLRSNNFT